ncbi:MAG TPA: alpha/beta fold hydrolase [Novosphingobium sp.]|nr:alpha/beta fold hydrolase [Novosphingobium sp.]
MDSPLPLLLLPGLMCDGSVFAPQLAAFPQAQARPGWGPIASLTAMAERALAEAPARFCLLGHSMGGRVALEMLRLAPERVARIALVSTGIHPTAPGEAEKRHALVDLGRTQGMAALVDSWLPPMIAPGNRSAHAAPLHAMCMAQGLDAFAAQVEALLARPATDAALAAIRVPTLVCTGALDLWSPADQHEVIAARIAGARLEIVEGAGHFLPVERAEAFNAAIASWLAG